MLINNQKMIFDKAGIGYNPLSKPKFLKNVYDKSQNHDKIITYYKYNKIRYKFIECQIFNLDKSKAK